MVKHGMKYDDGKLRWSLIPFRSLEEIVKVLQHGAEKYADDNWKKVRPTRRYLDAMLRHLAAFMQGQDYDKETGLLELAHIGCCVLFLLYFQLMGFTIERSTNDRQIRGTKTLERKE